MLQVKRGVIRENTIKFLRTFCDHDKSKWMSGLDRDQVLRISQVFKDFFVNESSTLASTTKQTPKSAKLLEEVAKLLLETADTVLLRHSIQSICDYLEKKLSGTSDTQQKFEHEKSLLSILELLRKCVIRGALSFEIIPTRFFESCIETALLGGSIHKEVKKQCLLLIVTISKGKVAWSIFKTKLLDCILKQQQMSHGRFGKIYAVGDKKVSAAAMAIASLVQYRLASTMTSSGVAFKLAFGLAAYLVDELCKKCESLSKDTAAIYSAWVSQVIDDFVIMNEDPVWPAAGLLLRMLVKKMCCYLLDSKSATKLKIFAVKQLPKIALRVKVRESLLKKTLEEFQSCFGKIPVPAQVMELVLAQYLEQTPADPLCGDACRATKVIIESYGIPAEKSRPKPKVQLRRENNWTESEVAAAAYFLESRSKGHAGFEQYVRFVLKAAASSNCKTIKSAAVKSLGQLAQAEPSILSWPNVALALENCMACASATGREAIAGVLGRFLAVQPSASQQYGKCLGQLMDDASLIVRRAAIEAVTSLFKKVGTFFGMNDLTMKILNLIGDPEEAIQKAVCGFFTTVWLDGGCDDAHLDCLLEVSGRSTKVVRCVKTVLMQIKTSEKAVCQSQAPDAVAVAVDDRLATFATAVTLQLQSETHRQAASCVVEALAQVHPVALIHHVAALTDVLCRTGERSICNTLVSIVSSMTVAEAGVVNLKVQEILKRDVNFEMPTANLAALLKLLIAVSADNPDSLRLRYILPSLELLQFYKEKNATDDVKIEVKRALCFLVYLWKDYATKDEEVASLISHYLKSPQYNLTVLSALCHARLEHIPSCREPFLEKLIAKFLSDRTNTPLTVTALYFLLCTLQGYQKIYQKPEMKKLGDSTTEVVSQLLQQVLPQVLECVLDPAVEVRQAACPVVLLTVQSGLILTPRLLPHLVAITTDPDVTVQNHAHWQLASTAESWDISAIAVHGFRLAFELARSVSTEGVTIRGFKNKTSTCHKTFQLVESSSPEKVRKLTESLIKEVKETKDFLLALFLMDQIIYFPYKTFGQVRHVVRTLGNVLSMMPPSSRKDCSLVSYLFQRGETFMMDAYKTAFKTLTKDAPDTWSKEPVHRSKSGVDDYVSEKVLSVLSEGGEKLAHAVRGFSDSDNDDDDDMDLPLNEVREKEKKKRQERNVCYEATVLSSDHSFTFHDMVDDELVPNGEEEKPKPPDCTGTLKEKRATPKGKKRKSSNSNKDDKRVSARKKIKNSRQNPVIKGKPGKLEYKKLVVLLTRIDKVPKKVRFSEEITEYLDQDKTKPKATPQVLSEISQGKTSSRLDRNLDTQRDKLKDPTTVQNNVDVGENEEAPTTPQILAEDLNTISQKLGNHPDRIPEELIGEGVTSCSLNHSPNFGPGARVIADTTEKYIVPPSIETNDDMLSVLGDQLHEDPDAAPSGIHKTAVVDKAMEPVGNIVNQPRGEEINVLPPQDDDGSIPETALRDRETTSTRGSVCSSDDDDSFLLLSVPIKVEKPDWSPQDRAENPILSVQESESSAATSMRDEANNYGGTLLTSETPARVKSEKPDEASYENYSEDSSDLILPTLPRQEENTLNSQLLAPSHDEALERQALIQVSERDGGAAQETVWARNCRNYATVKLERLPVTETGGESAEYMDYSDLILPTLPRQEDNSRNRHLLPPSQDEGQERQAASFIQVNERGDSAVHEAVKTANSQNDARVKVERLPDHLFAESDDEAADCVDDSDLIPPTLTRKGGNCTENLTSPVRIKQEPPPSTLPSPVECEHDRVNPVRSELEAQGNSRMMICTSEVKQEKFDWATQEYVPEGDIPTSGPLHESLNIVEGTGERGENGGISLSQLTQTRGVAGWSQPWSPPVNSGGGLTEPLNNFSDVKTSKILPKLEPDWVPTDEDIFVLNEPNDNNIAVKYITVPDDSDKEVPVARVRPKVEATPSYITVVDSNDVVTPLPLIQLAGKNPRWSTPKFTGANVERWPLTQNYQTPQLRTDSSRSAAPSEIAADSCCPVVKLERIDSGSQTPSPVEQSLLRKENSTRVRNFDASSTLPTYKNPPTPEIEGAKDVYLFSEEKDPTEVQRRNYAVKKGKINEKTFVNQRGTPSKRKKTTSDNQQEADVFCGNKKNRSCASSKKRLRFSV